MQNTHQTSKFLTDIEIQNLLHFYDPGAPNTTLHHTSALEKIQ
jgi:hypothetical protein